VFEITERSLAGLAPMLMAPLVALPMTPFVRPPAGRGWRSRMWSPLLPALFTFDGVVSNLRTYTPDELRAMTRPLQRDDYRGRSARCGTDCRAADAFR
jgi:hypothetical protein